MTGRLIDSDGLPYPDTSIVFTGTAGPSYSKELADTGKDGTFAIDLPTHAGYKVWLSTGDSTLTIGAFSFGDVQEADLENLVLESLPNNKFGLHVSGHFRFRTTPGILSTQSYGARIAAIYIDCPRASDSDCRGSRAHIFMSDHRSVLPPSEKDQAGASHPQVAPDNRSAGWLVAFDNCCTSYPLYGPLVVFRADQPLLKLDSEAGSIWDWHFWAGGKQVALTSSFPHGVATTWFSLFDVKTGHTSARWETDGNDNKSANPPPAWVDSFFPPS